MDMFDENEVTTSGELRRLADMLTAPRGRGYVDAFLHRGPYSPDRLAAAQLLRRRADDLDGGKR